MRCRLADAVERCFRDITTKRIRRGAFPSVAVLVKAIESYVAEDNLDPKPFIWTAKAGQSSPRSRAQTTSTLNRSCG